MSISEIRLFCRFHPELSALPFLFYLIANTLVPQIFPLNLSLLIFLSVIPFSLIIFIRLKNRKWLVLSLVLLFSGILSTAFFRKEESRFLFEGEILSLSKPAIMVSVSDGNYFTDKEIQDNMDSHPLKTGILFSEYPYTLYYLDHFQISTASLNWDGGRKILKPGEGFKLDDGSEVFFSSKIGDHAVFEQNGKKLSLGTGDKLYSFTLGEIRDQEVYSFLYVKDYGFPVFFVSGLLFCLILFTHSARKGK